MRKVATKEDLDRISAVFKEHKASLSDEGLDGMIVNCNQSLTNYAIARAYKKLGLFKGVMVTTKVRAKKYAQEKGLPL